MKTHDPTKRLMHIAEWGSVADKKHEPSINENVQAGIDRVQSLAGIDKQQLPGTDIMSVLSEIIRCSQAPENNHLIDQLRRLGGVDEQRRVVEFVQAPFVPPAVRRRIDAGRGGRPTVATGPYSLISTANSVNEGESVTFILIATDIADGTSVPYTITGIHYSDIGGFTPLTGSFVVNAGTASVTFTLSQDSFTEGLESIILTLDSILPVVSKSVSIADTSPSYPGSQTFILTSDVASVNNGNVFTVTLTTTYVADATPILYYIEGVDTADINGAGLTGYFYVSSSYVDGEWTTGTATVSFTATNTSSDPKTFVLNLAVAENVYVTINGAA